MGPKVGHAGTSSDIWVLPKGQHLEKTTAKSPGTSLCSDLHLDSMALGPQQVQDQPSCVLYRSLRSRRASQVALVVKNLPANAGDIRDAGLIP